MRNRWLVLCLFLGALVGYALARSPLQAQAAPLPFTVGDEVTLTYLNERSHSCVVGEVRGIYLRCDSRETRTSIGTARRSETWNSLESVVSIVRRRD
jgi:hypothetical protein